MSGMFFSAQSFNQDLSTRAIKTPDTVKVANIFKDSACEYKGNPNLFVGSKPVCWTMVHILHIIHGTIHGTMKLKMTIYDCYY
eukprot:jgi/Psemu1/14393/gm1.14393_g